MLSLSVFKTVDYLSSDSYDVQSYHLDGSMRRHNLRSAYARRLLKSSEHFSFFMFFFYEVIIVQ